jgi:hypothetical protein
MESPEIYYTDGQLIEAENKKQAVEIYNKKNNCSYFYGDVVAELDTSDNSSGNWRIFDNNISKYQLQSMLYTIKYGI